MCQMERMSALRCTSPRRRRWELCAQGDSKFKPASNNARGTWTTLPQNRRTHANKREHGRVQIETNGGVLRKKRGGDGKDTLKTTQSGVSERSSSCTIRLIVKLSSLREVSNVSNVPLLFITIKLKRWFCCLRAVWCWQQRSAGPPAVL